MTACGDFQWSRGVAVLCKQRWIFIWGFTTQVCNSNFSCCISAANKKWNYWVLTLVAISVVPLLPESGGLELNVIVNMYWFEISYEISYALTKTWTSLRTNLLWSIQNNQIISQKLNSIFQCDNFEKMRIQCSLILLDFATKFFLHLYITLYQKLDLCALH